MADRKVTKEYIAQLAVENDLVEDVYDILHFIIMAELSNLRSDLSETKTELKLIGKYADANKLDAIKDVLRSD